MSRRPAAIALALLAAGLTAVVAEATSDSTFQSLGVRNLGEGRYVAEFLSPVYNLDRIYPSMRGPKGRHRITLDENPEARLWVTGFNVTVVEPDGRTPMSAEFLCHSALNMPIDRPAGEPAIPRTGVQPLLSASQGQHEVRLPEGFGIPIRAGSPLQIFTQALNLNHPSGAGRIRHKISVYFRRDRDLRQPMIPVFDRYAFGVMLVADAGLGDHHAHAAGGDEDEASCMLGAMASDDRIPGGPGRTYTGHWIVKPGRHEYRTQVTRMMHIPYDTTVHQISVHLHPYAESVELRDLTTGTTVFKSFARRPESWFGLEQVDAYSSAEGLPVFADHEYELVSVYDNTSSADQDAMAIMHLYLREQPASPPS